MVFLFLAIAISFLPTIVQHHNATVYILFYSFHSIPYRWYYFLYLYHEINAETKQNYRSNKLIEDNKSIVFSIQWIQFQFFISIQQKKRRRRVTKNCAKFMKVVGNHWWKICLTESIPPTQSSHFLQ